MTRKPSKIAKNEPQLRAFCSQSAEIAIGLQAQIAMHLKTSIEKQHLLSPKEIAMFGRTLESLHAAGVDAVKQADKIMDLGRDLFIGNNPNPMLLPAENATATETIEAIKATEIWKISKLQEALIPGLENGDLDAIDRWVQLQELKLKYLGNTPDALETFASLVQSKVVSEQAMSKAYELYDNFRHGLNELISANVSSQNVVDEAVMNQSTNNDMEYSTEIEELNPVETALPIQKDPED